MIPLRSYACCTCLYLIVLTGCGLNTDGAGSIETGFAFTNFSKDMFAVLHLRNHDASDSAPFFSTALLPPGATERVRFLESIGTPCPASIDMRVLTYRRINGDVPISLDESLEFEGFPSAAGELSEVPVCTIQEVETLTIVNWNTGAGTARVKLAQGTELESFLVTTGVIDAEEMIWLVEGVDPALAEIAPAAQAEVESISGRALNLDGTGAGGVGVLLRSRFRNRLTDNDPSNDPDADFSEPIDFAMTDEAGRFEFQHPAGVYELEFFADDLLFRPASIIVEVPAGEITTIVEPADPVARIQVSRS